ncbi:MAG TPA: Hsp70 family protein, partial [Rugosimonospora sp.]|nr:Hsp70 family protein [Rugosimonospora sp.]
MPYALGIDIGSTCTSVALSRRYGPDWGHPEIVPLGRASAAVPSVLVQVSPDLAVVAEDGAELPPGAVIRGFIRRVGDDVPMLVGAEPYRPQLLAATLASWVADQVTAAEGEPPDQLVLAHPACWGPYRRGLLHQALWQVGLDGVTLLPEPVAVAEDYAASVPVEPGATLAIYSLGGTRTECAVVRRGSGAAFEVLASAETCVPVGGADFDDAILDWVLGELGDATPEDPDGDPDALRAWARLRERCAASKEVLSEVAATTIEVRLPGARADLVLTRTRFEELIRPALAGTLDTLAYTLEAAGVPAEEVRATVLVGGAAQVPLAEMLVATAMPGPVVTAPMPAAA